MPFSKSEAMMHSLVAEMQALVSTREGFVALNHERESHGFPLAYNDEAFQDNARQLSDIATALQKLETD